MTAIAHADAQDALVSADHALLLRCPVCAAVIGQMERDSHSGVRHYSCTVCDFAIVDGNGVWQALPPERMAKIEAALSAYESVRKAEGRWSEGAAFYRALPWRDLTGRFSNQWRIRAASFRLLQRKILPVLTAKLQRRTLSILDLGAGNCWMSYRLVEMGHEPVAVDISISSLDGLGASRHYSSAHEPRFACFQAEMDRLPFASRQFDLAIYNASLHYSNDYSATLREVKRVLRPSSAVVIVDTPSYAGEHDGQAMMREKYADFAQRYGSGRGDMNGVGYLTPERIAELESLGFRWTRHSTWYGMRWAARPLLARIAGRRTPSQFHIYLGVLTREGKATT